MSSIKSKSILTILTSLLYLTAIGQIKFEPGYIVDNYENKIDCLIENKDWVDNPASFQYKLTDGDLPKIGTVADIKEFGVYNYTKFVRAMVQLDTSNTFITAKLSYSRKPLWAKKILFLKEILKGNASLYQYQSNDILAYFFKTSKNDSIQQLVHKLYQTQQNKVGENIEFKQQLINEVLCEEKHKKHIGNIGYRKSDLKRYFIEYNTCKGDTIQQELPKTTPSQSTRGLFNLKVTPGISYGAASLHDDRTWLPGPQINFDFEKKLTFRVGLEAEFILPFNKNKWSVFIEPTFQYYEAKDNENFSPIAFSSIEEVNIQHQSLEFPLGFRYYSFLKNGSIFFNFIILPGTYLDLAESQITFDYYFQDSNYANIDASVGFAIGAGYASGPFSLETRYYTPQNLVYNEPNYNVPYQRLTLIAGFRFLEIKKRTQE